MWGDMCYNCVHVPGERDCASIPVISAAVTVVKRATALQWVGAKGDPVDLRKTLSTRFLATDMASRTCKLLYHTSETGHLKKTISDGSR